MTNSEFSNEFDILYNNIMSNQAPGLNEYEKSVFLTKAQDEIVKAYFNPNIAMEGMDGNERRQIDFSTLIKVQKYTSGSGSGSGSGSLPEASPLPGSGSNSSGYLDTKIHANSDNCFDSRSSYVTLPKDILMIINESLVVTRSSNSVTLTVIPISFVEYNRLMSKPFKRPLKNQAWRLITSNTSNIAELIAGIEENPTSYTVRYIKRPQAIILTALTNEGVTLDGGQVKEQSCELDPILHHEILQRAVELAKAAYTGDLQSQIALGNASQTDLGKSLRQ